MLCLIYFVSFCDTSFRFVSFLHFLFRFVFVSQFSSTLKKDAINEFGIKYWTSNPVWVTFQEHAPFMWILKKKYDYWWKKYGLEKTSSPCLVSPVYYTYNKTKNCTCTRKKNEKKYLPTLFFCWPLLVITNSIALMNIQNFSLLLLQKMASFE